MFLTMNAWKYWMLRTLLYFCWFNCYIQANWVRQVFHICWSVRISPSNFYFGQVAALSSESQVTHWSLSQTHQEFAWIIWFSGKMTKEGFKRRLSITISKFSRGVFDISCVSKSRAQFCVENDEVVICKRKKTSCGRTREDSDCLVEKEEKDFLNTLQPHRLRRSATFTGFSVHRIERLRCIAEVRESHGIVSRTDANLPESRRNRCHSFSGVKNKKVLDIYDGRQETYIIDGLLTTTLCSTEL